MTKEEAIEATAEMNKLLEGMEDAKKETFRQGKDKAIRGLSVRIKDVTSLLAWVDRATTIASAALVGAQDSPVREGERAAQAKEYLVAFFKCRKEELRLFREELTVAKDELEAALVKLQKATHLTHVHCVLGTAEGAEILIKYVSEAANDGAYLNPVEEDKKSSSTDEN